MRGPPFFSPSLINMSVMFLGPGMCCVYWGRRVIPHVSFSFLGFSPEEWGGQRKLGIRRKKKNRWEGSYLVYKAGGNLSEPLGLCCCHPRTSNSRLLPPEQAFNSLISVGSSSWRISYRDRQTKNKKTQTKNPTQLKVLQAANVNRRMRGGHLALSPDLRQEGRVIVGSLYRHHPLISALRVGGKEGMSEVGKTT